MFLTLQLPFADLRPFVHHQPETLFDRLTVGEPFECPERLGKSFVRSFGAFRVRGYTPDFGVVEEQQQEDFPSEEVPKRDVPPEEKYWQQLEYLWADEYCFAGAERGLLLLELQRQRLAGGKLCYPRAKVRTFHFSPFRRRDPGWSPSMRIETGVNYEVAQPLTDDDLDAALTGFLRLPTRVPEYKKSGSGAAAAVKKVFHRAPLVDQAAALARLIGDATTARREHRVHAEMVKAGAPLLAVHFFPHELKRLPEDVVWLPPKLASGQKIGYRPLKLKQGAGTIRVATWLFELPSLDEKRSRAKRRRVILRNYTIAVMRYWAELRTAIALRRSVADGDFGFRASENDLLAQYLNRCTNFLLKNRWHGASLSVIRNVVNAYEDCAEDVQVRQASQALRRFRRQIADKAERVFHEVGRVGVFVSYSHRDAKWRPQVQSALGDLQASEQIAYFDDTGLQAGEDWMRKIGQSIDTCSIAILLISKNFLDSEFISEHELPPIHDHYRRGKLQVVPVWLDGEIPENLWISKLQFLKAEQIPLAQADQVLRRQAMADLAARVGKLAAQCEPAALHS